MDVFSISDFKLAFWHPFGPHGGENADQIIERKREEIKSNGWTLWSFGNRPMLENALLEISLSKPPAVFVFCSKSPGARDPDRPGNASKTKPCRYYRFLGESDGAWHPIPNAIRVRHPFPHNRTRLVASAFVVQRVLYPIEPFTKLAVEWLSKENLWQQSKLPPRGEFLLRPGGAADLRDICAVLALKIPYLVSVSAEDSLDGVHEPAVPVFSV
jgi:hypothetical protein